MNDLRMPPRKVFCCNAFLDQRKRYVNIVLGKGKIASNTHSEYIAILTIHIDDRLHKFLWYSRAVSTINMECRILFSVLIVTIIKKSRQLGRVSTHKQFCSWCRKSTKNRFEYFIFNTAGLIYDIKHMFRMEALQSIWRTCSTCYRKPFFGMAFHV